jgi:formylmethanofuran dehydrogenase subunit C
MKNRLFLAALMILLSACAYSVNGEAANFNTNVQPLESFYGLIVNSPANVILEQGKSPSIRFEGEEKDLNGISTNIENGSLIISGTNSKPLTIYLTIEDINLIEVNGSARVYSSHVLNSDLLLLKVNGSGSIRVDVRSLSLGMFVKGSGKIHASGSTGSSITRIYGDGKVITTDLDAFDSTVELNDGKQAFRSAIRKHGDDQPILNQVN